jgi:hypothetical protein
VSIGVCDGITPLKTTVVIPPDTVFDDKLQLALNASDNVELPEV